MALVKKIHPDWNPQEHPGVMVGDIVDFPGNVERLVQESNVVLVDEEGNELSTYDTIGIMTEREKKEFEAWVALKKQQTLKSALEAEHDTLLAQAEALKAENTEQTQEEAQAEIDKKKKEFAEKMAAGRKAAAARKAQAGA